MQIYTRSVIDPIPAPVGDSNVDGGAKTSDKMKKKAKMTDEEIMEKLSMLPTFYIILKLLIAPWNIWPGFVLIYTLYFGLNCFLLGTTDSVNVVKPK